jgi:hypothetical protein
LLYKECLQGPSDFKRGVKNEGSRTMSLKVLQKIAKHLKMNEVARNMAVNTYLFIRKNLSIVVLLFVFLLLDRFKRMKLLRILRNLPIVCAVMKNFRFSFVIVLASLLSLNFGVFVFNLGLASYIKTLRRVKRPPLDVNLKLVSVIQALSFEEILTAFYEDRGKWHSEARQEEGSVFRVTGSDGKQSLMTVKFFFSETSHGSRLVIVERLVEELELGPGFIMTFERIENRLGVLKLTLHASMTSSAFKLHKKRTIQRINSLRSYFEALQAAKEVPK